MRSTGSGCNRFDTACTHGLGTNRLDIDWDLVETVPKEEINHLTLRNVTHFAAKVRHAANLHHAARGIKSEGAVPRLPEVVPQHNTEALVPLSRAYHVHHKIAGCWAEVQLWEGARRNLVEVRPRSTPPFPAVSGSVHTGK